MHLARAVPPSLCADVLRFFDEEVRHFFSSCIAVDVPDAHWQQAQLSQRFGGLGLPSLYLQCSAAFISSLASSGHGSDANIHLQHAVTKFNALVSPHGAVSIEVVIASPLSQRDLSKRLDTHIFQTLLASSLPTSAPHAGSWNSVVPSPGLNLHLDPEH